ncbi:hypothetical protein A3K78_08110 [Candidatus Bathyarchaeota archaeon RBG_13_52_12]|nr:MAG: hypothetical protein A3K78_08110 [Candidatus Bathyarchaeota archaeon RBG_13_52_12]
MFTREILLEARWHALRRRVWWSALDNMERGILSIAARDIDDVKSTLLNVKLVRILAKIKEASLGRFARQVRDFGGRRAKEISSIGVKFGSCLSGGWVDEVFARYFAFMSLNMLIGWSI